MKRGALKVAPLAVFRENDGYMKKYIGKILKIMLDFWLQKCYN